MLADYAGTEPGTLSVREGELVELLETSTNEWCLVKPLTHPCTDGWVPMAYLCPYRSDEYLNHTPSPHYRLLSSSDESDTPTEVSEQSPITSPEVLETYDNEEQRAEAEERRK